MTRFARRMTFRPEIADDAVQEAFLRLGDARVPPEDVSSPRAYVLRTVLNHLGTMRLRERAGAAPPVKR